MVGCPDPVTGSSSAASLSTTSRTHGWSRRRVDGLPSDTGACRVSRTTAAFTGPVASSQISRERRSVPMPIVTPQVGKWLWSKPLEGQSSARSRATNTPIAMSDSTVALVVGDDVLRFDHNGAVRWRVSIPEGKIIGRPAAGMDGSLLVHTTSGVYSINPEGAVSWRRVIGG